MKNFLVEKGFHSEMEACFLHRIIEQFLEDSFEKMKLMLADDGAKWRN